MILAIVYPETCPHCFHHRIAKTRRLENGKVKFDGWCCLTCRHEWTR